MNPKELQLKTFIHKLNTPLYLDITSFKNYEEYLKKCDVAVRSAYNKYKSIGLTFKKVDLIDLEEKEQLWNIWTSTDKRKNRPVNLFYERINGVKEPIKKDYWPIENYKEYEFEDCSLEFYAIYKDNLMVAYLEVIIANKRLIVHSTLGHYDYLKYGITKSLFLEVIKLKWNYIEKFIYGDINQKDFFKKDLLIKETKPMRSKTRIDCDKAVESYLPLIFNDLKTGEVLYVGTAGDPTPKGEYSHYFKDFNVTSMDADAKWGADITMDITQAPNYLDKKFDVIIMTQVIEHVPNLWEIPDALHWLLKPNGFLIIDCPFNYPYHPEPPSFGDYWRITQDGFRILFEHEWEIVSNYCTENNTSFLFRKI